MLDIRIDDERNNSIYVLLTDTGTWFTRLIKALTGAPYNHASLAMDSNLQELYSFGRKQATNPLIAGFVKENVYDGTFRHFPATRCVLLRIAVTDNQRACLEQVVRKFEEDKEKYRYNLLGLIGVLLDFDFNIADSYFCSQFVAESLRSSGVQLWERPSTLVTPHDFLKEEQFEVVYEGLLYHYPKLNRQKLGLRSDSKNPAFLLKKGMV